MSRKIKQIRFAVGAANTDHSSIWMLWAQDAESGRASHSDVYLATRNLAGTVKVSLHESGRWQWSLTSEFAQTASGEDVVSQSRGRHFSIWDRPPEFAAAHTLAFRVFFPRSELRPLRHQAMTKPVTWIPAPEHGHYIDVAILLGPHTDPHEWPGKDAMGTQLVDYIRLSSHETVFVVWQELPVYDGMETQLAQLKADISSQHGGQMYDPCRIRVHFFGHRESGDRFFIDCAPDHDRST